MQINIRRLSLKTILMQQVNIEEIFDIHNLFIVKIINSNQPISTYNYYYKVNKKSY